jgi:hypothetical protein
MKYNNLGRPGIRTTVTTNPQAIQRDIDEKVRSLEPEATPLITMSRIIGTGAAPKSKKMEVMQHYAFDHYDEATSVTMGASGDSETRYCRLTLAQRSRPSVNGTMFYSPQDTFYLPTGQNAMVVMTPDAALKENGSEITLTTTISGNSTTRSLAGTIVVRNIEPAPLISFTSGTVVYMGRTIYEGQEIEGISKQEDVVFDYNYVETMEEVLTLTKDQTRFVKTYGSLNDLTFQQEQTLKRFKKSVHYKLWFGERAVDLKQKNSPRHHTRGIINSIRSNVTIYDPTQTDDFERLVSNFMGEQAFRHNPNGNRKVGYCGVKFLDNFDRSFREYRRSELNDKNPYPGFHVQKYDWQGCTLTLVRDETFRQGTSRQNWCVVVDPLESQLCVVTDFKSGQWANNNDPRKLKYYWEWCGGIRHHREETSAILRTAY